VYAEGGGDPEGIGAVKAYWLRSAKSKAASIVTAEEIMINKIYLIRGKKIML
jgi:hypothetical protein